MAKLDIYLKSTVNKKASDLHFSSGEPVRVRVDGELVVLDQKVMQPAELLEMFYEILSEHEKEKFISSKNLDKSYSVSGVGNFRVNLFNNRKGPAAVLRTIPTKIPTIEDLGLPPTIHQLCDLDKGLVLVTGPTGSGKSTTLAAMINYINEKYKGHILTVEDPIEFVHESKQSLVNQREIGTSCYTFNDALKYALREDPDVILIGEMRDLETIALALTAAETGHLVFGTLHTRGAGASVDRIIDSFPANQQAMIRTMLAESLGAVISQALVKRAGGVGRVAAYEILVVNHAVSNLIREGKTFQIGSIMQTGRKEGMILMDQYLLELVASKKVLPEEAALYMENSALLGGRFAGGGPTWGGGESTVRMGESSLSKMPNISKMDGPPKNQPPKVEAKSPAGAGQTPSSPPPIKSTPIANKTKNPFNPLALGENTKQELLGAKEGNAGQVAPPPPIPSPGKVIGNKAPPPFAPIKPITATTSQKVEKAEFEGLSEIEGSVEIELGALGDSAPDNEDDFSPSQIKQLDSELNKILNDDTTGEDAAGNSNIPPPQKKRVG